MQILMVLLILQKVSGNSRNRATSSGIGQAGNVQVQRTKVCCLELRARYFNAE